MTLKAVAPQQKRAVVVAAAAAAAAAARASSSRAGERVGWGWGRRVRMPGATPAWCEWERARAPERVLLADIHGSCSGSGRVRARPRVSVSVCARTSCTVLATGEEAEGRGGGSGLEGEEGHARAGWGAASPLSPLPPSAA